MENQIIKIEDLEVGDEILISCQSYFKYLRVLVKPSLSKTKKHWRTAHPLYGNVRCSTRQDQVITYSYTDSAGVVHNRIQKTWITTSEDHNIKVSQDLDGRQIWLIKRTTI
jgi:hypothetical protein